MNAGQITLLVIAGIMILIGSMTVVWQIYLLFLVRPRARAPKNSSLLRDYAHRGLHGGEIPENSLTAFEKACEAGCGIELDVQLSRDGTVMVFHDYTLARMTGREGKLKELDAAELQSLSLNGTTETIPTFAEVLALVDGRVPLLVELKGENLDTSLCEKVASHLAAYKGPYCLESFNPLLIGKMGKYLPEAYRGLLYTNVCRDKKKYTPLNLIITAMLLNGVAKPHFIACNYEDRNALPVRLTTQLYSAPRFVWTVRDTEEFARAHELGEHAIFENLIHIDPKENA